MVIDGSNLGTSNSVANATLSIKCDDSEHLGEFKRCSKNSKNKKTKQLNYNAREISGQLLRAKDVNSTSQVLVKAKGKVNMLKKCLGTGEYNEREVLAAIAHARRMVNCAKKKVNNLREEEMLCHSNSKKLKVAKKKEKSEIKRKIIQKKNMISKKVTIDKANESEDVKNKVEQIKRKRRLHRSGEQSDISEADMKYLKDLTQDNFLSGEQMITGGDINMSLNSVPLDSVTSNSFSDGTVSIITPEGENIVVSSDAEVDVCI